MRKIDDLAINKYGVFLEEMMELAGFHLASLARRSLKNTLLNKKVVVLSGKGNDGEGGLVAVRYMYNWGGTDYCYCLTKRFFKQICTSSS
jgi:NAD(P)H-hydrate repair Nnr-like enzyme with NAD(P)H-hydrate epimerase domain